MFDGLSVDVSFFMVSVIFYFVEGVMVKIVVYEMVQPSHQQTYKMLLPQSFIYFLCGYLCCVRRIEMGCFISGGVVVGEIVINFMFRRNKSSSNIEGVQKNLFKESKKSILENFEQRTKNRGQNSAILVIEDRVGNRGQGHSMLQKRQRSASKSSSQLFKGAHSVEKGQTFLNKPKVVKDEPIERVKMRSQLLKSKSRILQKEQEVIERKLVITDKLNNSKLMISKQNKASRVLQPQQSEQLPRTENFKPINDSAFSMSLQFQSNQKQSKQGFGKNHQNLLEPSRTILHQSDRNDDFMSDSKPEFRSDSISAQLLKGQFQLLNSALKESIREEVKKISDEREQKLEQTMEEKEKIYFNQINEVYKKIESQLSDQKQLVSTLVKKSQIQFKQEQPKKKQPAADSDVSFLNVPEVPLVKMTDPPTLTKQSRNKSPSSQLEQIAIAKPVQRQKSVRKQSVNIKKEETQNKPKDISNKVVNQQKSRKGSEAINIWDEVDDINLSLESKVVTNQVKKNPNIDRSFNVGARMNDSFQSQRPTEKKKSPGRANSVKQPKVEKEKSPQEKRKDEIQAALSRQKWEHPYLLQLGKVVIQCNTCMRKSKVEWRIPSLLLYRYCYDCYRQYSPFYEEGLKMKVVTPELAAAFNDQINSIKDTMMNKILVSTKKKVEIDKKFISLVQSEEINVQTLRPILDKEIVNFVNVLSRSEELNDVKTIRCGLRMINSLFIIRKLAKNKKLEVLEEIQKIPEEEALPEFKKWMDKLRELLANEGKV